MKALIRVRVTLQPEQPYLVLLYDGFGTCGGGPCAHEVPITDRDTLLIVLTWIDEVLRLSCNCAREALITSRDMMYSNVK